MADDSDPKPEGEKPPVASNTISTGIKNGTVCMEFAEPTTGVYMSPLEAMIIADQLLQKAINIVQNPLKILRPS